MEQLETYRTELVIKTQSQEISVYFNTAVARAWQEIRDVIAKDEEDIKAATVVALKEEKVAAAYLITKEAENARLYIDAIRKALTDAEYSKIADIVDYIDISGLRAIAAEICRRYVDYYKRRVEELVE